tara:strand:- start:67 stop:357 length:291 start_codon:yes stop_codon:yes gene_type:complete
MTKLYKQVDGIKVELTSEEIALKEKQEKEWEDGKTERIKKGLRNRREPLLTEADHKINTLVDNGGNATEWRKYRQELRDITKASDLDNVTFPTKPS